MTLQVLAQHVMSDFKKLQEFEIVGRIMLFSNRKFAASLNGLRMLREQNLIPDSFIDQKTAGIMQRMLECNPNLVELVDRFDLMPKRLEPLEATHYVHGKPPENHPGVWEMTFHEPAPLTPEVMAARIHVTDLNF